MLDLIFFDNVLYGFLTVGLAIFALLLLVFWTLKTFVAMIFQ